MKKILFILSLSISSFSFAGGSILDYYPEKRLIEIKKENSLTFHGKDLNENGLRDDTEGFLFNLSKNLKLKSNQKELMVKLAKSYQNALIASETPEKTDDIDAINSIEKYSSCLENYIKNPKKQKSAIILTQVFSLNTEERSLAFKDLEVSVVLNAYNKLNYSKESCFN